MNFRPSFQYTQMFCITIDKAIRLYKSLRQHTSGTPTQSSLKDKANWKPFNLNLLCFLLLDLEEG